MNLLDGDFIRQCEGLRRAADQASARRFLGRRVRRTLAGGTDVSECSDYSTGDDYRYVDWNRAARLDELVSKQFHGAEVEDVHLLLDASRSMTLADEDDGESKFDFARQIAGATGYLALMNQDVVRVSTFADVPGEAFRPLSSKASAAALLAQLNALQPAGDNTDLTAAVEAFVGHEFREGLVVLISDLLDPAGFVRPLDLLRQYRFQPFVVQVYAAADADPGLTGKTKLHDIESGGTLGARLDANDLENYRAVFDEFCQSVRGYCARYQIGLVQVGTDFGYIRAVERMLRFGSPAMANVT